MKVCSGSELTTQRVYPSACHAYCNNEVVWRGCVETTAAPTTALPPNDQCPTAKTRCLGKALEGGAQQQVPGPTGHEQCRCKPDCHTCSYTVGGFKQPMHSSRAGDCEVCKNGQYLYEGGCIDRDACIATGHSVANGQGKFGKRCEPAPTTAAPVVAQCTGKRFEGGSAASCKCRKDCHSCQYFVSPSDSAGACTTCKNGQFLLDGDCVAASACIETGRAAIGQGKFGRACGDARSADQCIQGADNCHRCGTVGQNGERAPCTMCKNGKKLHSGLCLDGCPDGFFSVASQAKFNRICRPIVRVPTTACIRKTDNCHQCNADGSECAMCYNAQHLLDGACVNSCPFTTIVRGSGNFNRRCIPMAAACGNANCNTCAEDGQSCAVCQSSKYLFAGECVDDCPSSFTRVGFLSSFGRTCCLIIGGQSSCD